MPVGLNEQSEVGERLHAPRRRPPRAESMLLMGRDQEVVEWVHQARVATREQVQRLFFTARGRSRAQRRLTLLYRNRFLDKLPDPPLNEPDVYFISRHAVQGLRLLRTLHPEQDIRPRRVHPRAVLHTLEIGNCQIAITQACEASGFKLLEWLDEGDLAVKMPEAGFMPDAYFRIERPTPEGPKKSSFFLEVERSGKADISLERRFQHYGDFYYGGEYERIFENRALRVLVLVGDDYQLNPERQIAKLVKLCRRLEVGITRFAPLQQVLGLNPEFLLHARLWSHPQEEGFCSLF